MGCRTGKLPVITSVWHKIIIKHRKARRPSSFGRAPCLGTQGRVGCIVGVRASALECVRSSAALGVGVRCTTMLVFSTRPAIRVLFLVGKLAAVRRLSVTAAGGRRTPKRFARPEDPPLAWMYRSLYNALLGRLEVIFPIVTFGSRTPFHRSELYLLPPSLRI